MSSAAEVSLRRSCLIRSRELNIQDARFVGEGREARAAATAPAPKSEQGRVTGCLPVEACVLARLKGFAIDFPAARRG